jgi:hypothetical protein
VFSAQKSARYVVVLRYFSSDPILAQGGRFAVESPAEFAWNMQTRASSRPYGGGSAVGETLFGGPHTNRDPL